MRAGAVAELTAQDAEIFVHLAAGPEPIEAVRARVTAVAVTWDADKRSLRVLFVPTPTRVAEDVIAVGLRELLSLFADGELKIYGLYAHPRTVVRFFRLIRSE